MNWWLLLLFPLGFVAGYAFCFLGVIRLLRNPTVNPERYRKFLEKVYGK